MGILSTIKDFLETYGSLGYGIYDPIGCLKCLDCGTSVEIFGAEGIDQFRNTQDNHDKLCRFLKKHEGHKLISEINEFIYTYKRNPDFYNNSNKEKFYLKKKGETGEFKKFEPAKKRFRSHNKTPREEVLESIGFLKCLNCETTITIFESEHNNNIFHIIDDQGDLSDFLRQHEGYELISEIKEFKQNKNLS